MYFMGVISLLEWRGSLLIGGRLFALEFQGAFVLVDRRIHMSNIHTLVVETTFVLIHIIIRYG